MLNSSTWSIDGTLTDTTTLSQIGTGSNSNEGEFNIPPNSRNRTSPSDGIVSYPGQSIGGGEGVLPLCRDGVSVFYSPS